MTTNRTQKPTAKETIIEMKVISRNAQRKMPVAIQDLVATYSDAKALAAAEEIQFIKTQHSDLHWKRLVLQDITEQPKREENETFKQYYRRAYYLWLKIRDVLNQPDANVAKYRNLFIIAFLNGYEKYAAALIKKVNINDEIEEKYLGFEANRTFLHICAYKGNAAMMRLLLEHKANPNVQGMGMCGYGDAAAWADGIGNTPLILAAVHGKKECLALLLAAKADINYRTIAWKSTALHSAVKNNHEACVKILLDANAFLTIPDDDDKIPVELARENSPCEALLKQAMLENNIPIPRPTKCVIQ